MASADIFLSGYGLMFIAGLVLISSWLRPMFSDGLGQYVFPAYTGMYIQIALVVKNQRRIFLVRGTDKFSSIVQIGKRAH